MQRISTAKKARTRNSSPKLMATMFWDIQGILMIEYMNKGSTGEAYKEAIRKLKTAIRQKSPTTVNKRLFCFMTIAEFTKLAKSRFGTE
jgi:hypothetical protein